MDSTLQAIELIKRFEGIPDGDPKTVNLDPYLDPVKIWTIGWGHVVRDTKGEPICGVGNRAFACAVFPGGITFTQAEQLLQSDLEPIINAVHKLVSVTLSSGACAALLSFCFNVGLDNFRHSTLLKLILARRLQSAADEFPKWNKAKGKVLPGLVRRRAAERECFLNPA